MNCDQVFDILTRGPFPTGTACDTAVEAHLSECPECHRLAEALRPALELFQEAVGPEESRDLPGYWCAVATDRKPPLVSYAENVEPRISLPLTPEHDSTARNWSALAAWRLAAALALGVTLGSLLNSRGTFDRFSGIPPIGGAAAPAAPNDDSQPKSERQPRFTATEHQILAALPAACFGHQPGNAQRYTVRSRPVLASADLGNLNCCSECHNSNSDKVPSEATTMVAQRCQFCHKE